MNKKIIETYPYPLDEIFDRIIDYIVIYFDESGSIVDYNQMFNEIFKIHDDELQKLNIKKLLSFENINPFKIAFSAKGFKRVLIELNKKYSKNPMNNSYDCYVYKIDDLYCLIGKKDLYDSDEIMNNMSLLTNQLSNLSRDLNKKNLELKKANEKIESLLRHDELTELSNRRHFKEYIEQEIAKAHRHQSLLTLAMCDLDSFKEINDTYGHNVGDRVLKAVGKALINETRKGELAARIGGDEFAVILTQTPLQKGKIFAERIRSSISEVRIEEISGSITLSIGITELKENESFDSFFKRADMAMYKAKKSGRNKVCFID